MINCPFCLSLISESLNYNFIGLKIKREEIKELKNHLEERDELINKLQNQEKAYLEEADNLKVGGCCCN